VEDKLRKYSLIGLRTLCIAFRKMKEEEVRRVMERIQALADSDNREKEICNTFLFLNCFKVKIAEEIESDLFLLGCTAIEDKL